MGGPEKNIRNLVPAWLGYLLAVVLAVVSMLLRLSLSSRFGDDPALELFLIPIILSAYVGGLGPGLLCTALIAVVANYFLLPPKYSFSIQSGLHSVEWLVLILAGSLTCLLMESLRRSPPSPSQGERNLAWTEWKIRVGFALALAVLVVIAGMSYFSLVRLHEDRMLVDHTYQVIASLRLVPATFADARAATRGYIITGDEEFLQRLQRALADVDTEMQNLRSLTSDNAVQQRRLDTLEGIIAQRLELIRRAVEVRRREGFAAAQQIVASHKGEQFHERIVAVVAEMEATEQNLLQQRDARARRAGTIARTIIITGIALAFVFVAVALFMISQDFVGSRRAHAALQEAHDLLEARVQQRTAELARTNEALHDSETRLAGIINSAMDAIITVDEHQRIVLFNPAAEKMFGRRATEVIGQPLDQFIPERFRAAHAQHHRDFGQTGLTRRHMQDLGSISGVRANGEEFPIEASISKVDLGGRKLFTAILRDITERKRAEAALRQSEERLQRVTEGMTEGLVISEMQGELVHWNPAAIEMHGFTTDEVWRRQLPEFKQIFELSTVDGTVVPFEQWPLPRILRGERLREYELRVRRIDGDWERVFSYGGTLVQDSQGKQIAFCTIADITERKRAEEEIRLLNRDLERRVEQRTAELQAANKELESFSYSVAHDLRAPLRAMDGFSDAVLEDYGPQLPDQARQYLETIRRGAQRMGALIDDLLTFSRLTRQSITRQPVNMESLVRSVLADVVPEAATGKIQIVDGNLPAAHGDPALLRQVWANLLSNAVKYSRHAQQARIEIGSLTEGKKDIYYVRDNGAGFDMKYADKLFGVFQRLHRGDEFEGTGIGLAIVQRVVHRHGGQVWAEAKVNEGATFYFTLGGDN